MKNPCRGATDETLEAYVIDREKNITSAEELEIVKVLGRWKPTNVGIGLPDDDKERLVGFLRRNADIFAWSHKDMSGINPSITVHKLNVDPEAKSVRKKK